MAIRPVSLYSEATDETYAVIYFNSDTRLFYSDAACSNQINSVDIPHRSQYRFRGYRTNTSSATLIFDENGAFVAAPSWTPSTTAIRLIAWWGIFSLRFYIAEPSASTSVPWILRDTEFFRAVDGGDLYKDDQLTNGPITSILPPYRPGYAFNGSSSSSYSNLDKFGNILDDCRTRPAPSTYQISLSPSFLTCYKLTLNANGGSGGEAQPVWYDRALERYCSDDTLLLPITSVAKPSRPGKIFTGYFSTSSGGSQVVAADGSLLSYPALTSSNKIAYAQWADPITISLNNGESSGGLSSLFYGGGQFFASSELSEPISSVPVPTLISHRFAGYFSASSGGTKLIDTDGSILPAFAPSAAATIYAQFTRVSFPITISPNGGEGISALFANLTKTALYPTDDATGDPLSSITPLVRAGYRFVGIFSANSISATKLIDTAGDILPAMAAFLASMSDAPTIYALWQQVFTISLELDGGAGSPSEIYYDDAYGQFYDDPAMAVPVSSIATPSKECYTFSGFYSAQTGGTQLINANGQISPAWTPSSSATIYARWTFRSFKLTLDHAGGSSSQPAIYNDGSASSFFLDDQLTSPASSVPIPSRPGYTFGGYSLDGASVISAAGAVLISSPLSANQSAAAQWTPNTYTLTLDPNGGSVSPQTLSVTFGAPIGSLPSPTRDRAFFSNWTINGESISADTLWNFPANKTAVAQWELQFANVVDFFNLASTVLVPIASDSGDNRLHICCAHTGKTDTTATSSGVWRNPRVTYKIKADTTFNITLGRAFPARSGVSGYMIVAAEIQTNAGNFPTITVEAVANEGRDAINKWTISVPLVCRSKAQNLLSAIQGGGKLNACTIRACCDPVVVAENMMPCASDVVEGRIELSATTIATAREPEPTTTNGFTQLGAPKIGSDTYYISYSLKARKEL